MSSSVDTTDPALQDACETFLHTYCEDELARMAEETTPDDPPTLHIDWKNLRRYDPDLADDYLTDRERVEAYLIDTAADTMYLPGNLTEGDIRCGDVSVTNLPPWATFDVGDYKPTEVIGELRGVRGQVSRVTKPQTLATTVAYNCVRCGHVTYVPQTEEQQQEPAECEGCDRQGPFTRNDDETETINYQRVRLETPPERTGREGSEHLDVTLREDLVRAVRPGERVTLNTDLTMEETSDKRPTYNVTGDVMSVEHSEQDIEEVSIDEHREEIEDLAATDDILEHIVGSIAPSLYGYDEVKEALAYQLFGGRHVDRADGSQRRGTINTLLVGDPGTGKSELLQYMTRISPRSIYTSGTGTSGVGLTAAAVQDEFGGGGWTIKAGALVQAHNGICCIDELDDMKEEDRAGMLEAMSNLEISKTAAGESVTLPANTTILAGANPVHGRFEQYSPIAEQVDLDPALISRFDLIFTFQDERDSEKDRAIAEHMMGAESEEPEIPVDVLRAYVASGRRLDPELSSAAEDVLTQRYVDIRTANDEDGPVPTTPRLLEACKRLAEASARMHHRETVTAQDAERAADMMVSCLRDVGIDPETEEFDADVIETGQSKSQRERIRAVKGVLEEMEPEWSGGVPREELLARCEQAGIDRDKAKYELDKLSQKGEIYEPNEDQIKST